VKHSGKKTTSSLPEEVRNQVLVTYMSVSTKRRRFFGGAAEKTQMNRITQTRVIWRTSQGSIPEQVIIYLDPFKVKRVFRPGNLRWNPVWDNVERIIHVGIHNQKALFVVPGTQALISGVSIRKD
jgi:hypothetical protein